MDIGGGDGAATDPSGDAGEAARENEVILALVEGQLDPEVVAATPATSGPL
ncbi:MAG: hypothetical protein U0232_31825 [Thermomicrobiales bacterium]